jgi:5-methylcytosine-specific restriction endonuclease McrA
MNLLSKSKISLWDDVENKPIEDTSVLYHFLRYVVDEETEEEFLIVPDMVRWANLIREFKDEWWPDYSYSPPKDELALEFYKQHKKRIDSDKKKQKIFCQMFNVRDFENLKQKLSYPEAFYDEELRRSLFEEQEQRCGLCNKRIYPEFEEPDLHHIDYDKQNCSRNNLVFLCSKCHGKTNGRRTFWQSVLTERKQKTTNLPDSAQ